MFSIQIYVSLTRWLSCVSQLQKNCLLSLCSDRILQDVPFNRQVFCLSYDWFQYGRRIFSLLFVPSERLSLLSVLLSVSHPRPTLFWACNWQLNVDLQGIKVGFASPVCDRSQNFSGELWDCFLQRFFFCLNALKCIGLMFQKSMPDFSSLFGRSSYALWYIIRLRDPKQTTQSWLRLVQYL